MTPAFCTVAVTRRFDIEPAALFAHWVSPETRERWEAGPDSGMKYDGFDTRPGGKEIVRVFEGKTEIGHMVQRIAVMTPGDCLISTVEGHFGGKVTLLMQLAIRFERIKSGTELHATCQIIDPQGRDQTERHTRGWEWMLDRFEADIAQHGLIKP